MLGELKKLVGHREKNVNEWRKRNKYDTKTIMGIINNIELIENERVYMNEVLDIYEIPINFKGYEGYIELNNDLAIKNIFINGNMIDDLMFEYELEIIRKSIYKTLNNKYNKLRILFLKEVQ